MKAASCLLDRTTGSCPVQALWILAEQLLQCTQSFLSGSLHMGVSHFSPGRWPCVTTSMKMWRRADAAFKLWAGLPVERMLSAFWKKKKSRVEMSCQKSLQWIEWNFLLHQGMIKFCKNCKKYCHQIVIECCPTRPTTCLYNLNDE